jgi:flagellar protein FliO/FliZ
MDGWPIRTVSLIRARLPSPLVTFSRTLTRALPAAALGVLLTAPVALAATDQGENTKLDLPDGGSTASTAAAHSAGAGAGMVRTVVGLAVVLGVIFGLHWILKQVKSSKESSAAGTGLESLATLPLGTNRSLHLVRAGQEVVLLGSGEAGVTPIRVYRHDEARALGLVEQAPLADVVVEAPEPMPAAKAGPLTIGAALKQLQAKTVIR